MKRLHFIPDDGYTEAGYIKANEQLYPELRFTFRPVLTELRSQHIASIEKVAADAYDRKTAAIVAEHLTEWSVLDAKDQPVPITAKNILRLKPQLFVRLYGIVMGLDGSDVDPQWNDAQKQQQDNLLCESALTNRLPGNVLLGDAEKN